MMFCYVHSKYATCRMRITDQSETAVSMLRSSQMWLVCFLVAVLYFPSSFCGHVVQLTSQNFDQTLADNKLVFINFYADWCRFSQMLAPVFEQASDLVHEEFPSGVVFGRVDCESEQEIAQRFHITKYPTLKMWRNAQVTRREYRGQRSVDAFSKFIKEQMTSRIIEFHALSDLNVDTSKRTVIAYLESKDSDNFKTYEKVAEEYRDDCNFHVGVGDASLKERQTGENIVFRPQHVGSINFLIADGLKFSHPLHHLGKGPEDLPLVAIDSFKHMYLLPKFDDIKKPGRLKKFVKDLHSGKLHREFHHGPDPAEQGHEEEEETTETDSPEEAGTEKETETGQGTETQKTGSGKTNSGSGRKEQTSPPETVFKKLAPSYNRYTLLRDEL
ncbi:hypothetical protein pdam_00000688 [Pocillopora damicornis]|uniref:Thioredoxin domain-containing protein n=1 Tax=Pocillopora damicornis TaxID=46731 RepID=A0A3M6TYG1_POCDA|nr:hypothetical protein pdam_00000688 [Pocillopora damicornis]